MNISNKTPKHRSAKIVLAHNKLTFIVGIFLLLLVLVLNPVSRQAVECSLFRTPVNGEAKASGLLIKTEAVTTKTAQEKGLSGRPCIKDGQAMLFVFDQRDTSDHCFWMKNMRFSIDMVWLDASKRVVYRALDVSPSTYPQTFCPSSKTQYVLETKANSAERLGLTIGTITSF